MPEISTDKQNEIESQVLKRLIKHLQTQTEVQNIDLMNLSGFCRNCLAKWYLAECQSQGIDMDYEQARHYIYGMPYETWKQKYQTPASEEQQKLYQEKHREH